ncbi:MAG: glutamine synthetase [Phycisphaerales bacterium]|jgi:glutamine synthetase
MTDHPINVRDILKRIREESIEFVDFKFVDLFGGLQHITFPAKALDEGSFARGVNFDGSSVRGFQAISESDLILKPDPNSLFVDPFYDDPTLSLFCDILDPDGYKPYSRDPRGVAHRAGRLLRSIGLADFASFGVEPEFYLFDDVRYGQDARHAYHFVDSDAAEHVGGKAPERSHRARPKNAYFSAPPNDPGHNIRGKISKVMEIVGLTPELHHHEVGSAGQNEIGFKFGKLLETSDNAIKFKYTVKNTAARYNKIATFMPKPIFEQAGSGMHANISVWKDKKNIFYEPGKYADLSDFAIHFVGGILAHAPAVCAFAAATTNSYRRLVPGYEAPTILAYSQRNRSACVRVPFTGANANAKRVEFRTPDPLCNPYLALSAILLAGIDGVINKTEPAPPVDQDIFKFATSEHGRLLQATPSSLSESLDALEADYSFLTDHGVFSEDLIDTWLRVKREKEIKHLSLRPHPTEFEMYFDA